MPFAISTEEWEFVKTFFARPNHKVPKLPRSRNKKPIQYLNLTNGKTITLSHSYYRNTNGDIFAVGNKQDQFFGILTNRIKGTQGAVKRAENSEGKPYTVKIYDTSKMQPHEISFMTQEQQLGKKVRIHPTSTTPFIHSVISRDRNKQVIIMEFLGRDLKTWYSTSHPTTHQLLDVAIQITTLVIALHEGRLSLDGVRRIHRDLKLLNFTIKRDGTVHLIDYGALIDAGEDQIGKLELDEAFGTPMCVAPEVLESSSTYSFKSDIYSLGVTLVELFAKEKPEQGFLGYGWHEHCRKMLYECIPTIENPVLQPLIQGMIEKNPLDRPPLRLINAALIFERYKNDELGCQAALAKVNLSIATAELLMREDISSLLRTQIDRLLSIVSGVDDLSIVERAIQKLLSENMTSNDYRADAVRCLVWKSMPYDVLTIKNLRKILDGGTDYAKPLAASYHFLKSHEQVNIQHWVAGHGVRATHHYVKNILTMNTGQHVQETECYLEGKGAYSLARFWGGSNNGVTSRKTLFNKIGFFKDNDETLARSKTLENYTSISLPAPLPFRFTFNHP